MPGIIEESKNICDQKKQEYQELLKVTISLRLKSYLLQVLSPIELEVNNLSAKRYLQVRIAKFIDDLDVYELQCDEVQYWGEINELPKYVSRARRLDEK